MKRYIVQTFGCQMNVHDSRRIEEVLEASGYRPTDEASIADVIVVNTCSVREKAEHKLMSLLGTLRGFKAERPDAALVVAGCVAQQEGERLLKKAPHVDVVIGPDNIPDLPGLLRDAETGAPPVARTVFDLDDPRFLVASPRPGRPEVTAFVTTMKGCDERCTFCIVPTTRGSERYRRADQIVDEVVRLVEGGVKEITLLGQTVNSWYEPERVAEAKPRSKAAPSRSAFADLLRRIAAAAPGLERLRYTSPHPRHLTPELIAAHAELDVLAAHLHLPVQSGSNRVLRRMSRRYTREEYVERVTALKQAKPGLTLSTDMIVGFPGETEEDFEETLSLVREVGFVSLFGFKYSERPGVPALAYGDDVPEEVKDERLARLFEVAHELQTAHLESLVGSSQRVLVEGKSKGGETFSGRTERNEIVHLEAAPGVDPTGHVVDVEILEAFKHSLRARMTSEPTPAMKEVAAQRGRVALPVVGA
ncbi:MAG: tRNA (N6-isopentenyl adenosine(37)-C2)-methylthiotransferase MiaB [Myxococcales bacterium]|nr:tRNA (N6-isopentenyl adenosine(37)-C2)-methylthiotransferase MiaB [Myxococcales bacterium]